MKFTVTLLNNEVIHFDKPTTPEIIATKLSKSLAKNSCYAIVNNIKVRMDYFINSNSTLQLVTIKDNIVLPDIHAAALKMIVQLINRNCTEIQIIKTITNDSNFIIDFDYQGAFKEHHLKTLQNKITKLSLNFKPEDSYLLNNSKHYKNFEFLSISGVYLNNDKNQKMIKRIVGIAGPNLESIKDQKNILVKRSEADHRVIGKSMKLFTFIDEIGPGLPIWLSNGTIIKNLIKNYLYKKEIDYNYSFVETPIMANKKLYITSGHWAHYHDVMFPVMKTKNNDEFILRPMTCPDHILIFKNSYYSYRDLPIRFSENALLYRYESSGSLTGLERVRAMELTDSHIFVIKNQLKAEFIRCFNLIMEVLKKFHIKIDYFSLSTHDPNDKEKFYNNPQMWSESENTLKLVLKELKIDYKVMKGEAAFYGPKLDIQIKSILDHEVTISTIQLDFLNASKFDANYISSDSKKAYPIIIHRGLIGTYERFISILLEQTKGFLPLWLMPVQVIIIPIAIAKFDNYINEVMTDLRNNNIRVSIDNSNERLNYKIRQSQIQKIPYQVIIGKNEMNKKIITFRKYGEEKSHSMKLSAFILNIQKLLQK